MSLSAPPWSGTELEIMRVGLAFAVVVACAKITIFRPTGPPGHPVGIARFVDLEWVATHRAGTWIQYVAYASALLYVANFLVPFALVVLAVVVILDMTVRSSYGAVNHGYHLLAVVLMAEAAAVVTWNAAQQWGWDLGSLLATSQDSTAAWWAIQAIVAVYFTSGVTKLIATRGRWVERSPGLLLSSLARRETDALMGSASWGTSGKSTRMLTWLLDRPDAARALFGAGLLVELVAPVGLFGAPALFVVGIALIALHQANGHLLGLSFPEYQILVFVFLVNVPQLVR